MAFVGKESILENFSNIFISSEVVSSACPVTDANVGRLVVEQEDEESGCFVGGLQCRFECSKLSDTPSCNTIISESNLPSEMPSNGPSSKESVSVTDLVIDSDMPSLTPSDMPIVLPQNIPTLYPTSIFSTLPTRSPSAVDVSEVPSMLNVTDKVESTIPTLAPFESIAVSQMPSAQPTSAPVSTLFLESDIPSLTPSMKPSDSSTIAEDSNIRISPCATKPNVIGYSSISDINADQVDEVRRIEAGSTPKDNYIFVLCPDTIFNTSLESLNT